MDLKFKKTDTVQMLSRDIDLTKNSDASVFFNKNQSNRAGTFFSYVHLLQLGYGIYPAVGQN